MEAEHDSDSSEDGCSIWYLHRRSDLPSLSYTAKIINPAKKSDEKIQTFQSHHSIHICRGFKAGAV